MKALLLNISIVLSAIVASDLCIAKKRSPSLYLNTSYALLTHKSKIVESNDTSSAFKYSLGVFADDENFSIHLDSESSSTAFELNSSSIAIANTNTTFRYYLSWFYLGIIWAQSSQKIANDDQSINVDAIGNGYGANLGVNYIFRTGSTLFLDVKSISISNVKDYSASDFAIGSKMDISIGSRVKITRELISGIIAYETCSYSYTLSSSSYIESMTKTWMGLGFDFYF